MAARKCDRCGGEGHYFEECSFCGNWSCQSCQKSSRRAKKTVRKIICKDCWADPEKRRQYKSA